LKVPIFLFTLMYNIGVCSMGALNFIFHNSAAGLIINNYNSTCVGNSKIQYTTL